ncbi:MAG TPA: branched-chain amino acid ABC transporter permease [Anaeromyxobacteraceae bacterium]
MTRRGALRGGMTGALLLAAALLPLAVRGPSPRNTAIVVLMTAQLGVAWNILGGYAGQVSLGHAAFFGCGAYTSTLLLAGLGLSPWLGMLAGAGLAAALAVVIGWPCFRLRGHYFAMATIAVGEIVQAVVTNSDALGGAVGLYLPLEERGLWGFTFKSKLPYHFIALALLALSLLVNWAVVRSRAGYYLRAIKDDPDAARSVGISLTRYKLVAIALSSALTAAGGTLYAQKELYIDPGSTLSTALSIKIALVCILGGVGSLLGPVLGAIVLTGIEEGSRVLFGGSGRGTDLVVYGLLIVGFAVFKPEGIGGWLADLEAWWLARPAGAPPRREERT